MATELGQAYVQIMPSAKGIKGKMQGILDPESKKAGKSAGLNIGTAIKGAIIATGIGKALKMAITEGGALEQSIGGIETLFKDSAGTVRKYADEAYKTVGVSANDYMENVTSFSASLLQSMGGDTKEAAKVAHTAMIDMGDNANKMGTDMRDIQNAYQGFAKENYTMLDNLKLGYGGTKSEMERLLADAQKLTGVEYDISNLDDVFMAVHAIQEEIGITGTTALEAEETIQGSLNALKAAFSNTMGSLAIGEGVQQSFSALAETASTFLFGNLLPMIGEVFSNLPVAIATFLRVGVPLFVTEGANMISSLAEGIANAIPELYMKVIELMARTINWIRTEFPTFVSGGVEMISNFANGILEGLPNIISSLGNIIAGLLTAWYSAYPTIMQGGFTLVTNLAKGIWENLPAIVNSITNVLSKLLEIIAQHLPEITRKGFELVGKLAMGIWNNLPQIISTMSNLLGSVITRIGSYLPRFLNEGLKLIGQMAVGIIKAIPGIVAKIPQVISALIRAFSNVRGRFRTIGSDLIKGLWAGIDSVRAWIGSKINGFMNGIVGGIKKFFGIASPSKVMANEVGKWLPVGLADGIEKNTRPVTDAMNDLTDLTTGAMTSELAMSTSIGGRGHNLGATNQFSDERLYGILNQILQKDWNVYIDGKEASVAMAPAMSQELERNNHITARRQGVIRGR